MKDKLINEITDFIRRATIFYIYFDEECNILPIFHDDTITSRMIKINRLLQKCYISLEPKDFENILSRIDISLETIKCKIYDPNDPNGLSFELVEKGREDIENRKLIAITFVDGELVEDPTRSGGIYIKPETANKIADEKIIAIEDLQKLIIQYKEMNENFKSEQTETEPIQQVNNKELKDKLTAKQQILLLDLLGVLEPFKELENTKKSILLSNIIDKDPQNIRDFLTYFLKEKPDNSNKNPLFNKENPNAVIELLESIGLTDLANTAKARYKTSLDKKKLKE